MSVTFLPEIQEFFDELAKPHFDRYGTGMYYASFKKNRDTTWYAFFTKYLVDGETVYLVRYINNNHMIAKHL